MPEEHALQGTIVGADAAQVWIAAVGADPEKATWTLVEGGRFEIPMPSGKPVAVVAVARDRVPLAVAVTQEALDGRFVLALSPGLWLGGSVRSEDGRVVGGADVRVAAADAVVLEGLALAGLSFSLQDAKMEIPLGDGRTVEVPPFARPAWRTSGDGTFRVGGLEAGRYFLEAAATGFVPAFESHIGIRADAENDIEVELFEASYVAGHVLDGDGGPVAGAEVRALWHVPTRPPDGNMGGFGHHRRRATARTGDDGSFRLGPLDGGPLLRIFAESTEYGSSAPLHVHAPYEGLVVELGRHIVSGRVTDVATGEPPKSFRVTYKPQYQYFREGRVARLGDGRFEMPVAPDTRLVRIEAPERFPWVERLFTGAGGKYDLGEIGLEMARSITGRVRDARSGEPVPGALVRRSPRRYQDRDLRMFAANHYGSRAAETDQDGRFVLEGLPPGADLLEVVVESGGAVGRTIRLPADVGHLEIALGFDGVISGSLALPDGAPVAGTVRLWEQVGGSWTEEMTRTVGKDGAFRWFGIGDGEYRVSAQSDAGFVPRPSRTLSLRDGVPVEGVHLVVQPGGRVLGTLGGLARGELARVEVLDGRANFIRERVLGNGSFSLAGVPDHGWLAARTSDGRFVRRSILLNDEDLAQIDIDFSGDAQLTGIVSAGGRRLAGMRLAVVPKDEQRPTAHATTSELGQYAVQGLSEGPYSVRTGTGYTFDVHVVRNAVLDIELPPVSLSGRVGAQGTARPVGGGLVSLAGPEAADVARPLAMPITSDGTFRFDGIRAGEYMVRVSHRDFAEASRRVRVSGDDVVEFRLRPHVDEVLDGTPYRRKGTTRR